LERVLFACDEVAGLLLGRIGRSKEEKELLARIEKDISTLACQGRAFGFHLLLATQRPDANTVPPQCKANLDYRICGRADNVLSLIILDNTSASDEIPKDVAGRFINHEGVVF